jgi:hypothetical protein
MGHPNSEARSPYLHPAGNESLPAELEAQAAVEPAVGTLGDLGVSATVDGAGSFGPAIPFVPFRTEDASGISGSSSTCSPHSTPRYKHHIIPGQSRVGVLQWH